MELEIIDFNSFPPDAAPDRKEHPKRRAAVSPATERARRRQEAMFFPEAEELY